jgi:hypothetical protein
MAKAELFSLFCPLNKMLLRRLPLAIALVRLLEELSNLHSRPWNRHPASCSVLYLSRASCGLLDALGDSFSSVRFDRLLRRGSFHQELPSFCKRGRRVDSFRMLCCILCLCELLSCCFPLCSFDLCVADLSSADLRPAG